MKPEMKAAGIFAKAGEKKLAAHERREAMGKEKDTPAIAKKEMSVLKKAKAPADVMKYEKAEHKAMKFAKGGGIESKGKTRGKVVKMAEGGFAQAFKEARNKGAGTKFTWNGKEYAAYRDGEQPDNWRKKAPQEKAWDDALKARKSRDELDKKLPEVSTTAKKLPEDRATLDRINKNADRFAGAMEGRYYNWAGEGDRQDREVRADKRALSVKRRAIQKASDKAKDDEVAAAMEDSGMKRGGPVKKYAGGGSIDGCASRGKTKGRYI